MIRFIIFILGIIMVYLHLKSHLKQEIQVVVKNIYLAFSNVLF